MSRNLAIKSILNMEENEEIIGTTGPGVDLLNDNLTQEEWNALCVVHRMTNRLDIGIRFDYSISIDLERFIKSKSAEKYEKNGAAFFIPDNYELAKKVMSEFKKIHPNKEFKIIENHFRECANWESKKLSELKLLADFITVGYICSTLTTNFKI